MLRRSGTRILRRHWDLCVTYSDSPESKKRQSEQVDLVIKETLDKHLVHNEGFVVDQESDPMSTFHLATAFEDVEGEPVPLDAVFDRAKAQFKAWCTAFWACP